MYTHTHHFLFFQRGQFSSFEAPAKKMTSGEEAWLDWNPLMKYMG